MLFWKKKTEKINFVIEKIRMLKIYYRIWVSLFLSIKNSQNGNENSAILLSLIVLSLTNFLNVLFFASILVLSGIEVNLFEIFTENRFFRSLIILLVFLLPNYFLLINDNKHKLLLEEFENQNKKNLGIKYFVVSSFLCLLLVFLTVIFPEFFNLTVEK
jgi:hypothetical protein